MLETQIVSGVHPAELTPRAVARRFRARLEEGARLCPAGEAREDPELLLGRYAPRFELHLFGAVYWLTPQFQDADIGFLVGYVGLGERNVADPTSLAGIRRIYPRIFYKDLSLVWRVGTHIVRTDHDNWIGKGDVKTEIIDGEEWLCSAEETTNLPLEIQGALDEISRVSRVRNDHDATRLVLRRAPADRIEPYADFTAPRRRANELHPIHGGHRVARFRRKADPTSLVFARGYEPDFDTGVLEFSSSKSRLYGGDVRKYRVLSVNRLVQYPFCTAPEHVWVNPPQALSTELSIYGVRTLDVACDEELFVPGFEYHYVDEGEDPPRLHSQIPEGFVGGICSLDEYRCDASPWIEEMPVVREFRRKVLGR